MKFSERVRRLLLPMLVTALLTVPARAECAHEYVQMRMEPTCDANGVSWYECTKCGDQKDFVSIPMLGHSFGDWTVLEGPTCTREGVQVRECTVCNEQEEAPMDKLGHDYVTEVVEPTCTARGKTVHQCSRCGDRYISDETPPLGHRYDDGIILTEPTEDTMGRILYTCIGCGDTYQLAYPMVPFVDIEKNTYYYTPILWALSNEITAGIDETHFGPNEVCNRAQVVTFLWRAAGKPESSIANPFVDVPAGCFYEQAVLWAYEMGITTGTDPAHFSPEQSCTRAQVVTFLHRYRGCPEPTVETVFPDVDSGDFYYKAVLWAAQRGITLGMDGGLFCPHLPCTRAQIVTFLYRDAKNP